ncbi:MAG: STAS-like domain-containing protein, partial [Pseudomonadota bacterium]
MDSTTIRVTDFTRYPGGRYSSEGPGSGEEFCKTYLVPALGRWKRVHVVLAGAYGYPISFLEEAFGGLVRAGHSADELRQKLKISAGEDGFEPYVDKIWSVIE